MLTKNDLKVIGRLFKVNVKPILTEIKVVNAHNSRIEMKLIDMEHKFEKNLLQWKSDLFDKIDKVLGRMTTAEEENTVLRAHGELEPRLKKLEDIHPGNRHQVVT